jgi:hypothetical protein
VAIKIIFDDVGYTEQAPTRSELINEINSLKSQLEKTTNRLEQLRLAGEINRIRIKLSSATLQSDTIVLQNRDRSTAPSIAQMNAIAAKPDFLRLGLSKSMDQGAPVAFGDIPEPIAFGRDETIVDGLGDRYKTYYAVVLTESVITSNNADGTGIAAYKEGLPGKLRVVAGNARAAGLIEAYHRGTAAMYCQELIKEAPFLGLKPKQFENFKTPILVRIMRTEDLKPDIGDRSNISATQRLSAIEQAANDAIRINFDELAFDEDGDPTTETLNYFVNSLPKSEQGDMMSKNGAHTRQAVDRLMAAIFKRAYGSDELVMLYAQATKRESRTVMAGLAQSAGAVSKLRVSDEYDIGGAFSSAASMAINGTRQGIKLADMVKNQDLDMDPDAFIVAEFMAKNIRSGKKIANGLSAVANFASKQVRIQRENLEQHCMFGDTPTLTRQQILEKLKDDRQEY